MTEQGRTALAFMRRCPAALGRQLGYSDLRDELHGAWMRRMLANPQDMTLQAHRGSYKTTCLCIVLAILMATQPDKTILFLRKTDRDVAEVMRQVTRILSHPAFERLTALIYAESEDASAGALRVVACNQQAITTDAYAAPRGAAQLLGLGLGGSLTGKHADIIITDDIVNLRDRVSHQERERTRDVYMELQNIKNRGGRIINCGTPWHKADAFCLMPPAERYDCYQTGLISPEKLEELKRSMSPSLFAANYELRHIASERAIFKGEIRTCDEAGLLRGGIAHIDAAYGGRDFTALTCAQRRGGTIYLYGRLWRAHVDSVLTDALHDCGRLLCAPVFCESNGDKGYLGREIRRAGAACRVYPESMNKRVKIAAYLRKWWDNIVFLRGTDDAYIEQILSYTEDAAHDDAPDSAACACRILDARAEEEEEGRGYVSVFERFR